MLLIEDDVEDELVESEGDEQDAANKVDRGLAQASLDAHADHQGDRNAKDMGLKGGRDETQEGKGTNAPPMIMDQKP